MEFLQSFKDVAPFLQHPLVLIGFVVLLFFGILTALLKTGILPQISKKAAAELAKRVINFGFIIALLIIALGFWQYYREPDSPTAKNGKSATEEPKKADSTVNIPPRPEVYFTNPKRFHRITLEIPSDLHNADITVDGKFADVIEEGLSFVVLRMEERETGQKVVLKNQFRTCTTNVLVDSDKSIRPCLQ
ncbi:MAG: hypothetical protein KF749_01070 [Bacteroidetes bacterium]|nr:hypothetical protein [Bacteroidota bacterium]MCW5897257.1 hypothetical protein [Bacteroidota bacterium]